MLKWQPPAQTNGQIQGYIVMYTFDDHFWAIEKTPNLHFKITFKEAVRKITALVAAYTGPNEGDMQGGGMSQMSRITMNLNRTDSEVESANQSNTVRTEFLAIWSDEMPNTNLSGCSGKLGNKVIDHLKPINNGFYFLFDIAATEINETKSQPKNTDLEELFNLLPNDTLAILHTLILVELRSFANESIETIKPNLDKIEVEIDTEAPNEEALPTEKSSFKIDELKTSHEYESPMRNNEETEAKVSELEDTENPEIQSGNDHFSRKRDKDYSELGIADDGNYHQIQPGLKRSNVRELSEVGFEITTAETATAVATSNQMYSNGDAFEKFDDITQLHSETMQTLSTMEAASQDIEANTTLHDEWFDSRNEPFIHVENTYKNDLNEENNSDGALAPANDSKHPKEQSEHLKESYGRIPYIHEFEIPTTERVSKIEEKLTPKIDALGNTEETSSNFTNTQDLVSLDVVQKSILFEKLMEESKPTKELIISTLVTDTTETAKDREAMAQISDYGKF
ncbi:hypothetical protein ACTXT7_003366 [Hymenolepis weldensis]